MTALAWLTAAEFAKIAEIAERRVRRALTRAMAGRTWRGHRLIVRPSHGRGGAGGLQYEVLLSSLPPELRAKWGAENPEPSELVSLPVRLAPARGEGDGWKRRAAILAMVDEAAERSTTQTAAIEAVATGRDMPCERSLRAWLKKREARGVNGLVDGRGANRGKKLFRLFGTWDALADAAGVPDNRQRAIVAATEKQIRTLYAKGAPGWKHVEQLARVHLIGLTRGAGVELSDANAWKLCCMPKHVITKWRGSRWIAIKEKDAKQYHDRAPFIRRDRSHLLPMDIVCADVHPVDILYRRADGSTATPRMIGWEDLSTNRLFASFVFLEPGKGVTQRHVIESFIAMTQAWGMPKRIQRDHGKEFDWTPFIEDALRCASYTGHELLIEGPITKARPHNPKAKPIEPAFGSIERGYFSIIPGWIGGNRMTKKTQNVGREPEPFPGSTAELESVIHAQLLRYEVTQQSARSHLNCRSPRDAYAARIAGGWRQITIDRHALEAVFSVAESAKVRGSFIRVAGVEYHHDGLIGRDGDRVHVRVPKCGDLTRIAVLGDDGRPMFFAERAGLIPFHDADGARESSRRVKVLDAQIADMKRDIDPSVDLVAESAKVVALHPHAPIVAPAGRVRLADHVHEQANARRALPSPREEADRQVERQRERYRKAGVFLPRDQES